LAPETARDTTHPADASHHVVHGHDLGQRIRARVQVKLAVEEEMAVTRHATEQAAGLPAEPQSPDSGASELRWRELFPGEERQLSAVRRWVESLLPQCPARDDVTCVATELGTNAVRHTATGHGGCFAVEIIWHQQLVRVAVTDGGAPDGPQMINDPLAVHGRGLRIVQGMSARTGVCGDHRGRLVWADIPWPGAVGVDTASPPELDEATSRDPAASPDRRANGMSASPDHAPPQRQALAIAELPSLLTRNHQQLTRLLDATGTDVPRPPATYHRRPAPEPLDTEQQARDLLYVRVIYAADQASPGNGVISVRGYELLTQACAETGAELGEFDRAVVSWLSGLEPEAVTAIAGIILRAGAPGPGSHTQHLQALEDALKFRRARSAAPCADCATAISGKCDDHGRDIGLIAEYERTARRLLKAAQ
jgi:serine/threonine-protein kinase RsbW